MKGIHHPFVLFGLLTLFSLQAVAATPLILAVHPFLSSEEIIKKFTPLANHVGNMIGRSIVVKVASSYDEHIQYIGGDKVDIAYMGPASYVNMIEKYGTKPVLVKLEVNNNSFFKGNIVVKENDDVKSLDDLKGRKIAFGDPNSTMSYIVPHHMLHKAGVFSEDSISHDFLYSHDNVALGVLSGDYSAGAIKPAVFRKYKKNGLKVLASTPEISEHLFVTRSDMPQELLDSIRDVMLGMHKDRNSINALHAIKKSITGLVVCKSRDYDNLRKIIKESKTLHQ